MALVNDFIETPDLEIDDLREQRAKLSSSIDDADRLIQKLKGKESEYEARLENLTESEREFEKLSSDVSDLKETASNLVKGQAGASIGKEFEERKEELRKSLRLWAIGSIVSIAILIISSFYMYYNIVNGQIEGVTAASSLTLILPISVAVWFTVSNYNKQKRLMNEYEFKSNVALSLMGFREVLKEDVPEEEQVKVGDFVSRTMERIYEDPYQNIGNQDAEENPVTPSQHAIMELLRDR